MSINKNDNIQRSISFKPLFRLLIDKDMTPYNLRCVADISPSTMTKIKANKSVTLDTLVKICTALDCSIEDIVKIE